MSNQVYEHFLDIKFRIPARKITFKPYKLVSFVKTCNYFTDFIPKYELTVKIFETDLDTLRTFDKEISVFIKDMMFYGENEINKNKCEIISEQEFACYYDKNSLPDYMSSAKTVSSDINDTTAEYKESLGKAGAMYEVKFYLLLKDDLKMRTFVHNYIFGSEEKPASPINAVAAIVDQNPYIKKCIIDKPDNTNTYTDLIVEPAELKIAIQNIQYKYGIYSKSLELFYDNGILYILNKMNLSHSYQKDEIQTINVKLYLGKDAYRGDEGVYIDTKNGHIIYTRQGSLQKEDLESINGILSGNKFVFSNFGTVINSMFSSDGKTEFISPLNEVEKIRPARIDVGTKKILDYDMLNNPFNMSSFAYEESKGVPIAFGLKNVNPNHFTPNKIVKMSFDTASETKLHSGLYNIESAIFIYTPSSNPSKRFNAFSNVILKLCNKQDGFDSEYAPII